MPNSDVYLNWKTWLVYLLLLIVGVPWYWPEDTKTIVLGMPIWAVVSLGASLLCSIYTAWLLLCFWPEPDEPDTP